MSSLDSGARPAGQQRAINALIAVLIVAAGIAAAYLVMNSAPRPGKIKPQASARLVEAETLALSQQRPQWRTGGRVLAAQQVQLTPQVSGRIIDIAAAAVPGARLNQGDLLARIDPADYQLQLQQRQAALIKAQAALEIEQGQSSLAAEEYQLAATELSEQDKALVLRKPQIAQARAEVKTAKALLRQAQLNLQRSYVRMPFDGQINSRHISLGSQVSAATVTFDLVNSDEFWIEVKVPADFLALLDDQHVVEVQQSGWGQRRRQARVLHRLPAVDSADRQAKLMLVLDDPLARDNPQLPAVLLNDFVEVVLFARPLANSYQVANRYIDQQQRVWVVNDGQLQQRQVEVLYQGRENSWVATAGDAGLQPGDRLLSSRVDAPVSGMPVRVVGDAAASDEEQVSGAATKADNARRGS